MPTTPSQLATAFGLPAAKHCVSKRHFEIRLRSPRGVKIRRAKVTFNGHKVRVRKRVGRFRASIDLRGLAKGRFTVAIRITLTDGRTVKGQRKYRTCARKRRAGKPRV